MNYNILHVNTAKSWRGGEQQVVYLIEGLHNGGHHNYLACQPGSVISQRLSPDKVKIIEVSMKGEWDLYAVFKLVNIIKKYNIEILHLHTAHAHTLGLLACIITPHVKVIVSRRVDFHVKNKIKYNIGIDKIITVSEQIRKVLIEDGIKGDKIVTVYSGTDIERFKTVRDNTYIYNEFSLSCDAPVVGIVAALAPHKHHKNFLYAAKEVKNTVKDVKFIIVGEGELEGEMKELCADLGLDDEVIFTGFRNDILEIMSVFDIFVLSSYLEGMGSILLEALGLGIPVVATATGGIPEVIKDNINGILVEPRNSTALANGIITLLRDTEKAKILGVQGKNIVGEFSKEKMVEKTEQVYKEVMRSRE